MSTPWISAPNAPAIVSLRYGDSCASSLTFVHGGVVFAIEVPDAFRRLRTRSQADQALAASSSTALIIAVAADSTQTFHRRQRLRLEPQDIVEHAFIVRLRIAVLAQKCRRCPGDGPPWVDDAARHGKVARRHPRRCDAPTKGRICEG